MSADDVIVQAENSRTSAELHQKFDATNPGFWAKFEALAFDMIAENFKHYSAGTILHLVRHHYRGRKMSDQSGFDVNDHAGPYLARRFHEAHPQHAPQPGPRGWTRGFFACRRSAIFDRLFPGCQPPPPGAVVAALRLAAKFGKGKH